MQMYLLLSQDGVWGPPTMQFGGILRYFSTSRLDGSLAKSLVPLLTMPDLYKTESCLWFKHNYSSHQTFYYSGVNAQK